MARGGGVRLATKGLGIAYGFIGFVGGLVIDYLGRVVNPSDRTSSQISTMDMIELGGLMLTSLIGYVSPGHGEWVPLSAGLVNGKLYASIFGPRLFGKRYILTSIDSRGQLTSGAGYFDDTSNFGGGYLTEDLSTANYPTMPVGYEGEYESGEGIQQFANTGPIGDQDLSDIYDYEGEIEPA
jgi:hypothetical protein